MRRISCILTQTFAPVMAGAECLEGERLALSNALEQGGGMSHCRSEQQVRLSYEKRPAIPSQVRVPLGDIAGMNRILKDGTSSAFACAAGKVSGSLDELNEAALNTKS